MSEPVFAPEVEVSSDMVAVFSTDGRVFYDLRALVAQYAPHVIQRHEAAQIIGNEADKAYVQSEVNLLNSILSSVEDLLIEYAFNK